MTSQTETILNVAHQHMEQCAWNQAAESYTQVLAMQTDQVDALYGLAQLAFHLDQKRETERLCLHVLDLYPQHANTWLLLGSLHEAQDELDAAILDYEAILSFQPEHVAALLHLGRCLTLRGEANEGLRYLRQAAELAPNNIDVFYALGLCYHLLQMPGSALDAFAHTIAINPSFLDGYVTIADLLAENRRWLDAKKVLLQAESLFPSSSIVIDKLAAIFLQMGDVEEAMQRVRQQVLLEPDNLLPMLNLSTLAQLKGDWEVALQVTLQLVEIAPKRWESHYHLGSVLDVLNRVEPAKAAFRQAIALAPEQWKPYNNLAYLLNDEKNPASWQEAARLLEQAIALAPEQEPLPRYNLVLSLTNLKEEKTALQHCVHLLTHMLPHHDLFPQVQALYSWLSQQKSVD